MSATNQNQDSLKMTQNNDGSFTIEWDPNDSKWSFLNHLTSQELSSMISKLIKEKYSNHDQ